MISPFRILEILICSLVTFLPYVLVTVYPFRNNLRCGQTATAVFTALAAMLQLGCDIVIAIGLLEYPGAAKMAVLLIHILLFLILIRASFGKKLLTLLGSINFALVISMGAYMLEGSLFPAQAEIQYHWTDLLVTLVLQVVFLVPYGIVMIKRLAPALSSPCKAPFGWLWLLNALVIIAWLIMGFFSLPDPVALVAMIVLAEIMMLISAAIAHRAAPAKPVRRSAPRAKAEPQSKPQKAPKREPQAAVTREPKAVKRHTAVQERPEPAQHQAPVQQIPLREEAAPQPTAPVTDSQLQVLQRNNLMERIAESDQFHRELIRHVDAMAYRLERQQYEKLHLHVHALQEQLSKENQTTYCDNKELNSVISYFIRMAGYCGAQVFTNMHVAENAAVSTADLTVMLGSLLDYALDACKDLSGYDRRIYASVRNNGTSMYVNVEFTCDAAVQATGIGMNVCQQIAERYTGSLDTSYVNGIFKATAILHPNAALTASADQYCVLLRENLMERVAESDQFHRELLRHVDAMAYRLERRQYDKLHLHVHALQEQLTRENQVTHCSNKELNSVIAYFIRMAGYCGTRVYTNMHVSGEPVIPTKNLTVMLGNLLDNALEACKTQTGFDRRIYASVRSNGTSMYVNVEYTSEFAPQDGNTGLNVCRQIANRYNGQLELSNVNGICKATAILRP